jgi:hypothetical protein
MTGDVPQHCDLDDHHIVPDSWGKKYIKDGLSNSILNRTPLTADTNRQVIKARLQNAYLPELVKQSGETTVRAILESHFISRPPSTSYFATHSLQATLKPSSLSVNARYKMPSKIC